MTPVVVLDTNVLYGKKPFTRADSTLLFALSKAKHIALVVPEVVLLELARQWEEAAQSAADSVETATGKLNQARTDIGLPLIELPASVYERSQFLEFAKTNLESLSVDMPPVPSTPVAELLARDLAGRKPFTRDGKGFRDALIWESVRDVCARLADPAALVLFVTANSHDFCDATRSDLDPDLRRDLPMGQAFEVVSSVELLKQHNAVAPLVDTLRVVEETFTPELVSALVDDALAELVGVDVISAVGSYDGEGMYSSPFSFAIQSATFDEILVDEGSIAWEVFLTGSQLTLRVVADAQCSFDGYIDKSDYLMGDGEATILEDWNSHMFRAAEQQSARFTLSAEFTPDEIGNAALTVDDATAI